MSKNLKEYLNLSLRVIVAMSIFVIAATNYESFKNIDVRAIVDSSANVMIAVGAILCIYWLKSVLFILPASLIYISVGMAFDTTYAVLISFAGIFIEVTTTYFLGRFLGGEQVNNLLMKNKGGKKLLEKNLNNSFLPLFTVRVLPVFPIDFVSLFLGASKCGFGVYLSTALLGIMPRVVLFTILGDGIYDYIPIHMIIGLVILCIPIGTLIYLVRFFIKKSKAKKVVANS